MNHPRLVLAAAVLISSVLAITVCTSAKPAMTREQATKEIVDLVDQTAELLPVTGWQVLQSPYEGDCSVNGGKVWYSYDKKAGSGEDPAADAETVAAFWRKHGLKVAITKTGSSGSERFVDAEDDTGRKLSFAAIKNGYSIGGVSSCVP